MKSAFGLIFTMCLFFSPGVDLSGQSGFITNNEEVRVVSDSAGIHSDQNDFDSDDLF